MAKQFMRITIVLVALAMVLSLGFNSTQAQDDIPRGGTVVVSHEAFSVAVRNFNPFAPVPNPGSLGFVWEPLLVWNEVDGAIIPWLATGYEWGDDLLSITFKIREGVMWNDGEPFSAEDVVFTLELIKEYPALDRAALWEFLESVTQVDNYTVLLKLSKVFTQAHILIGQLRPVPKHIYSKLDDPITFTDPDPVATGPFSKIGIFRDQVFELCRNELYWQEGKPYVDCLRYPAYPGNEQSNLAMINGEIDWAGHFVPDVEQTYVAADPENFHYYFWPGGGTVNLYAQTTKPPFDDVKFRAAMSMAIDYESVVNIGMYTYTVPSDPGGLGPRFAQWASAEALAMAEEMGLGKHDPEKAKAALDAAGYVDKNGDGWRDMPNGDPIEFSVQVVNGWTDWVTSVQIISQNFQDVGLNATVRTPEFGDWLDNLQLGTYDVSIGWSSSGYTPWNYYRGIMLSTLIGADNRANEQSWARWNSPEADALISAFVSTADAEEQMEIIADLQKLFIENVVVIPLFPGPTWYEWNTRRFTGFPTPEDYYTQGSPWSRDSNSRLLVSLRIHCKDNTSCGQ